MLAIPHNTQIGILFPEGSITIRDCYNEDIDEIFIEPPDAAVLTDEDYRNEDKGGVIDNLSSAQLQAQLK